MTTSQKKETAEAESLYGLDIDLLKSLQLDDVIEESKQKRQEE